MTDGGEYVLAVVRRMATSRRDELCVMGIFPTEIDARVACSAERHLQFYTLRVGERVCEQLMESRPDEMADLELTIDDLEQENADLEVRLYSAKGEIMRLRAEHRAVSA